jgi:hypothetical protein
MVRSELGWPHPLQWPRADEPRSIRPKRASRLPDASLYQTGAGCRTTQPTCRGGAMSLVTEKAYMPAESVRC